MLKFVKLFRGMSKIPHSASQNDGRNATMIVKQRLSVRFGTKEDTKTRRHVDTVTLSKQMVQRAVRAVRLPRTPAPKSKCDLPRKLARGSRTPSPTALSVSGRFASQNRVSVFTCQSHPALKVVSVDVSGSTCERSKWNLANVRRPEQLWKAWFHGTRSGEWATIWRAWLWRCRRPRIGY